MCGIVAVIHADAQSVSAAADLHDALYLLQHRGQDACGITTCASGGRIHQCKGNGMAAKVFDDGNRVASLPGYMGVGHLRYPTAGTSANAEAQPMFVNAPYGLAFTHNGNLTNAAALRVFLDKVAHRHINTESDSELMLNVFASELNETGKARVNEADCIDALRRCYDRCQGAWACVAMIAGFGLLAFRDPHGIRPLCMGFRTINETGRDYMIASESVALQGFGCAPDDIVDVKPGEAILLRKGSQTPLHYQIPIASPLHDNLLSAPTPATVDIFEYVYISRPDSCIDGISVYASRRNMGRKLGARVAHELGPEGVRDLDVVIPIPETASAAAKTVAEVLGKPCIDAFVKNRYIFRTFIMPNQKLRRTGVRRKLNAIQSEFRGRNVLLVDDSIVRGTTSKEIVQMAREAGAKKVLFASCAPPITHPHIHGVDLASTSELIAFSKSSPQIASAIGADGVIYQTLPDLEAACAELSPSPRDQRFEVGVFSGQYVTPVDPGYLDHLEAVRGAAQRSRLQDKARIAVANGILPPDAVVHNSPVASPTTAEMHSVMVNGDGKGCLTNGVRSNVADRIAHEQDISLHNLNDDR